MKSFKKAKMVLGVVGLLIFLSTSWASAEILEKSNEWNATQHGPWLGIGFTF
jgi:hypothetical protein